MKYMLFTYRGSTVELTSEQRAAIPAAIEAWCTEMDARGVRLQGHVLAPLADTRTVRVREGERLISGGPVIEAKEQIAGFSILECADLDEALEVASKNPGATFGTLELRPIDES
jgi:hypothetical protein